jgi:tRNA pseudouridine38-40 synthase
VTRYALLLEYDGAGFVGWQRQDAERPSVQLVLERAAARLSDGAPVASVVAGRTDSGVHAEGQVAHLDLPDLPPDRLRDALNFHMKPHDVVVLRAAPVPPGWSARFDAIGRAYRYRILNRRVRPALARGRVWHVPAPLDAAAMAAAAALLLGRHDFTSFRAAACQANSPVRTLDRLDVTRDGDRIDIVAEARSFLHHQVRNLAGTLRLVGDGSWPVGRVAEALAARDRRAAGPTAPPDGLALVAVRYDPDPFSR